jgi:hypothetical protein
MDGHADGFSTGVLRTVSLLMVGIRGACPSPRTRNSDPRHRTLCTSGSNKQKVIMLIVNWELLSADPFVLTERAKMEDL